MLLSLSSILQPYLQQRQNIQGEGSQLAQSGDNHKNTIQTDPYDPRVFSTGMDDPVI